MLFLLYVLEVDICEFFKNLEIFLNDTIIIVNYKILNVIYYYFIITNPYFPKSSSCTLKYQLKYYHLQHLKSYFLEYLLHL